MLSIRHHLNAVNTLRLGGVIAYPTESVFGFGCDPFNSRAITRLLDLKQRPVAKGLIVVAAELEQLEPLLSALDQASLELLMSTWPGPVTWLIPDPHDWMPPEVKGDFSSVAVRVSAHPIVQSLCLAWGGPIVSTSANRSGQSPYRSEYSLLRGMRNIGVGPDYVVPGRTQQFSNPTEIRDLQTGRIIRAG